MKTLVCILLFAVCAPGLYGQSTADTLKFNNRFYKREIGIGVNGVFDGRLGNALILKIRDDRSKLVPVSYSKYWRFQANWNLNQYSGFSDRFEDEDYVYVNATTPDRYLDLGFSLGRERNNFYGRFNFYYGWDVHLNWRNRDYQRAENYIGNNNQAQYVSYQRRENTYSASGYGFIGVKYHISKRISVSVESAFLVEYLLTRGQTIADELYGRVTEGNKWNQHEVNYGLQYLRFATLNYHFRRN